MHNEEVREAAAIWARATARRDDEAEPATVEQAMPGILRRLSLDGAELIMARREGRAVGFALVAPRAETVEVFYLAVDPDAWGGGVGSELLREVDEHARAIGRDTLELWVINDNERAIAVYERAGWVATGEVSQEARPHRRFLRRLG
ncbi:hypothetical protein GCM10022247_42760 [Allokutzneria multivorans]|uniref:N-acetyltransferase domain-containing protein n=1 Tax=Allokutzneria multivorans TaxID=1142134 RepID=A0ABP7SRR1_9PSEU